MPTDPQKAEQGAAQLRLERILGQPAFEGLKAILDCVSPDREQLCTMVQGANTYVELLARLGFRLTLTRQIHVRDSYSRLGPAGGIQAVLPYHDIPTHRSLPTLVNYDGTVIATPESTAFFDALFLTLKQQFRGAP